MASDEERLAGKSFDALEPVELAQLYRLMTRLELATPLRRTRRHERGRHGRTIDLRRTLRASLRTGGDPIRLARRRRRVARRRLVMLCDISGSMEPYARAYLQFLTCAAGSGPNAEAFVFATRLTRLTRALASRHPERAHPARRGRRAGLVERDPDRRRAEDVQRPPRPARHGARRGRRDPLRRLGARRPGARRARDGAPGAARAPDRVGQPARERERVLGAAPAAWWRRCRTATRWSAATASRRSARSSTAIGGARRRAAAVAAPPPAVEDEPEPWASATPVAGSSVAMPSGHGPSKGNTTPGWVTDDDGRRPASTPAASARRCRRTRWAGRSRRSATSRSTTR